MECVNVAILMRSELSTALGFLCGLPTFPLLSAVVVLIGSIHKLVAGSLNPRKITCLLYITSRFDLVNTTVHPALHRTRMPINDAIVNLGTMCPVKIVGRPGIVMSHMCVDFTLLPSVDSQRLRQRSQIVDRSTFHDKYGSCTGVCNCLVCLNHNCVEVLLAWRAEQLSHRGSQRWTRQGGAYIFWAPCGRARAVGYGDCDVVNFDYIVVVCDDINFLRGVQRNTMK